MNSKSARTYTSTTTNLSKKTSSTVAASTQRLHDTLGASHEAAHDLAPRLGRAQRLKSSMAAAAAPATNASALGGLDALNQDGATSTSRSNFEDWIEFFLTELVSFADKRVNGPDSHHADLIGKEFSLEVTLSNDEKIYKTIKFGEGLVSWNEKANKVCYVDASFLYAIFMGEALFEDLYTGYNAEWARNPVDVYNRDIVMMIVMFSYVYKNRISALAKDKFLQMD